jgi:hypothetical protein
VVPGLDEYGCPIEDSDADDEGALRGRRFVRFAEMAVLALPRVAMGIGMGPWSRTRSERRNLSTLTNMPWPVASLVKPGPVAARQDRPALHVVGLAVVQDVVVLGCPAATDVSVSPRCVSGSQTNTAVRSDTRAF